MIGAFSKRGVEPFISDVIITWRRDDFYQVKMASQEAVYYLERCSWCWALLRVVAFVWELSCSLVQVVRLVEDDNLQFLLPRVALPSKLFARATWGPIKGGLQSLPWSNLIHTKRTTHLSKCHLHTRYLLQRVCKSMHNFFSQLLIIRVNEFITLST